METTETTTNTTHVVIESSSSSSQLLEPTNKLIECYSDKLDLKYTVNIKNEAVQAQQRCFILTIHDIGYDSSQFDQFVQSEQMTGLRNRVVWLHVNLPGQHIDASDLSLKKYPSLEDLGNGLVCIVDCLKIPQVVCMGNGVGANVCAHFAVKHSNRCLGLVLIEPITTAASLFETIKFKLKRNSISSSKSVQDKASLLFNRIKSNSISSQSNDDNDAQTTVALLNKNSDENETLQLEQVDVNNDDVEKKDEEESSASSASLPGNSQENNIDKLDLDQPLQQQQQLTQIGRNVKNLTLFSHAFSSRSSLIEKIKDLNTDILIAVGKDSLSYNEAKKFYRSLQENRKKEPKRLVNCPFLDLENTVNVLQDRPERLASGLQYFLQGIGLLSAMPMMKSSMLQYARSISMEEADRPRSSSIQSDSLTSPLVSSNPSITESN